MVAWIEWLSHKGAILSSMFMLAVIALIGVEIILRSLFNTSTLIADEYSGYFMVSIVMFGLAYTLRTEGHIRITLLTGRLKGKAYYFVDTFASFIALALTAYCFYFALKMVLETHALGMRADSIAETPLYIPQIAVPMGLGLLGIELFGRIVTNLIKLTGGKENAV